MVSVIPSSIPPRSALTSAIPVSRAEQVDKRDILIVDDEEAIRKMVARILHHHGYQVITAEDGSRVIDLCLRHEPTLIFLDMLLPNTNGARVIRELRSRLGDYTPRVVLMTGNAVSEEVLSELGVVAYLQKPISIESIIALAKKYAVRD